VNRQTKENPMSRWSIHRALAFRSVLVLAYIALYGSLGYTGSGEVGAQSVGAVSSALVPAKFQATTIATGMTSPTAMATAPDGRIFVTQQDGRVRLIKNDILLAEDFYVVDADDNDEHGLLGIAVDPEFLSNQFVYLYYTAAGGLVSATTTVTVAPKPTLMLSAAPTTIAAGQTVTLTL
jgi:glucose/arabinose dehydrogenase